MHVNIPSNPDKMSSVPFVVFQYELDGSKLSLIFLIIYEGEQMLFPYLIYNDLLHDKYSDTYIVMQYSTPLIKDTSVIEKCQICRLMYRKICSPYKMVDYNEMHCG